MSAHDFGFVIYKIEPEEPNEEDVTAVPVEGLAPLGVQFDETGAEVE